MSSLENLKECVDVQFYYGHHASFCILAVNFVFVDKAKISTRLSFYCDSKVIANKESAKKISRHLIKRVLHYTLNC